MSFDDAGALAAVRFGYGAQFKVRPELIVEFSRGGVLESEHRVIAVLMDTGGRAITRYGNCERVVPVRSTVKPLQVLPLLRIGAADTYQVSSAEIALACGSHRGESLHREAVEAWLKRLDLQESDLQCPASNQPEEQGRSGHQSKSAHNCSGKHTGFLTLARHLGCDPRSYLESESVVQKLVIEAVATACGTSQQSIRLAGDGCGAPVACMPLTALCRGLATLLQGGLGSDEERVLDSMAAHPRMVGGGRRFDTRIISGTDGAVITKVGAEGLHVGIVRGAGVVIAVKALDGGGRAAQVVLTHLLQDVIGAAPGLEDMVAPAVYDGAGKRVGDVRVVDSSRYVA